MKEFPLVLQLDKAGNPQQWINFEQSCYHESKDNIAWAMGEIEFDVHGGTCAATGERTVMSINTIVAIKGQLSDKAMKHYNRVPLNNKTLFRRDQNLCGYCADYFPAGKLTRDHVHPTSKGGKNIWTNVVTACERCNKEKDNHLLNDIHMNLVYVPYVPNRAEWLLLQNRKVLADQMEFLMKKVPAASRLRDL